MSLELIHWYILDTDKSTIVRSGVVQAAHIGAVEVLQGQTLRIGVVGVNPYTHWEKDGHLIPYTPGQKVARAERPGRGWLWRASKMAWEDRRPVAWVKEDKIAALHREHEIRRVKPVTFNAITLPVTQENLHRVVAASAGMTFRTNDLRWRDENGTMQTWATGATFLLFAKGWATAVSQQFADVDKWKDDLLDAIDAAQFNAEIDAITW